MKININTHSSIQVDDMAFDPYNASTLNFKAKYIFITHTHYDHLDISSIKNISDKNTIIIAPHDAKESLEKSINNKIICVKPYEQLTLGLLEIEVLPAYNINKQFHKKEYNWVGYKVFKNGKTFAVLGDTDATPELEELKNIDTLFIPIGGTYTMNAEEAATLTNKIKPNIVIPVHYNSIVGSKEDEQVFISKLNKDIKYQILI